jgi:hypothetical protein
MVRRSGLKPGAVAEVDADDHEQWRQVKTTRELLLLLLLLLLLPAIVTCCVCSLAVQTGQQKLLTLLHPYLLKCHTFTSCESVLRHRTHSCACCTGTGCSVWGSARESSSQSKHASHNIAASCGEKKHAS